MIVEKTVSNQTWLKTVISMVRDRLLHLEGTPWNEFCTGAQTLRGIVVNSEGEPIY